MLFLHVPIDITQVSNNIDHEPTKLEKLMIELSSGIHYSLNGTHIIQKLDKHNLITSKVQVFDLSYATALVTSDSIKDDDTRNRIAHAQRKRNNMMAGAVFGALIDGSEGDDSVIDGMLLGAAFGSISTGSPSSPRAQIGIIFVGGEYASFEVNKHEYAQIQTLIAANVRNGVKDGPAKASRQLTRQEADAVLSSRNSTRSLMGVILGLGMGMGAFVLPKVFVPMFENSNLPAELAVLLPTVFNYAGVAGLLACAAIVALSMIDPKGSLNSEELKYYEGLKSS